MSYSQTIQSFIILNVLALQNWALLGSEPNHIKVVGVFVINDKKFFWQIFYVLGNISLDYLGLAFLTDKQC